jgi:hypothetical protein
MVYWRLRAWIMIELDKKLEKRMAEFKGFGNHLGSAIGALAIGKVYGWRVVMMIYSIKTVGKFNKILGVRIQDVCPEETKISYRSWGFRISKKVGAFWKVAKAGSRDKSLLD